MAKMKYNSASDRRFQQRYQRIQERKESALYVEDSRKARRIEKKTMYRIQNINIERMEPNKVAVRCSSPVQIKRLFLAAERYNPGYTRFRSLQAYVDGFILFTNPCIGLATEDYTFFEDTFIRLEEERYFLSKGFEVIDFCELLPVKDLGNVRESSETVDFLLGI